MLLKTRGIVLRKIKYGETSLICTIFTEALGIQSYLVQGVRTTKTRGNKAGLLQPCTLLDIVAYQKEQTGLQRLKEFQPSYIYSGIQEDIIKNSIALFSAELLLKLLPEHAKMEDIFQFAYQYFCSIDKEVNNKIGNYPIYFVIQCSKLLGYDIHGNYSAQTPYIDLKEGAFVSTPPAIPTTLNDLEIRLLSQLVEADTIAEATRIAMNATQRFTLLDWYIEFLQAHTEHMRNIKSLAVLRAILH
ncbi:MAG: DNA repair protein RecO [Flavipsychrobacter sp.]